MIFVHAEVVRNIKTAVDGKLNQVPNSINYAAKLQKGNVMYSLIPKKEGLLIMLEFDEFKLELDKYKGSLAELGESL